MKSPYKSKKFWAGVWAALTTIVSILPPDLKQPIVDYWEYVNLQVSPGQLSYLGSAVLAIWGDEERIDWKRLAPTRSEK